MTRRQFCGVAAIAVAACVQAPRRMEEQIAGATIVTRTPLTLAFAVPLRARYPCTRVFFELPDGQDAWGPGALADLQVTLLSANGDEWPLHLSPMGAGREYVTASAPALIWREREPEPFVALRATATEPRSFKSVVWLSFDPRDTKGGIDAPQ
jgi:hypothetical protein